MKIQRLILKNFALVILLFAFSTSCTKKNDEPAYSYFISKDLVAPLTTTYINGLIDNVSGTYPEVANLKPLVTSDINIYSIVYRTKINGNEIKASGLVCTPSKPGTYPVLSFQNGTNTLYSYAPSKYPLYPVYQMVEILASMGYVVVIADYPGFGSSESIPHPYLVKEPTVRSLVDMLYAVKELAISELPGITLKNDYYLLGYSQGGWATLALHKSLELDYSSDFDVKGSACGAGPYDISLLLSEMKSLTTYPQPYYLGFILYAYSGYNQFTNPVSDIFNEPYASRVPSLYNGLLTGEQINSQLTTTIADLLNPDFINGFSSSAKYLSVRTALENNSITGWHSYKPLLLLHGTNDKDVNPVSTENMYSEMISSGTSADLCKKILVEGVDHGGGIVPCMLQGIYFLNAIRNSN